MTLKFSSKYDEFLQWSDGMIDCAGLTYLGDELMHEGEGMRVGDRDVSNADLEKLGFGPEEMQDSREMRKALKEALGGAPHAMHIIAMVNVACE